MGEEVVVARVTCPENVVVIDEPGESDVARVIYHSRIFDVAKKAHYFSKTKNTYFRENRSIMLLVIIDVRFFILVQT